MEVEWVVQPGCGDGQTARCFSTFEESWACERSSVSQSRSGRMFRVELDGKGFCVFQRFSRFHPE